MARASAGFAPRGHVEREDLAVVDQLGERRKSAAEPRHGPDIQGLVLVLGVIRPHGWGIVGRRRRTKHAGDLRLVEEREEHADALDDRRAQLGVERRPVVDIPTLDGVHLLGELAPGGAGDRLGPALDLQLREQRSEFRVEAASHPARARRHVPVPVLEGLLVRREILGGDDGPHRTQPQGLLLRLLDLLREELRVHSAAVDVPERDPAPRQEPVKLDDPAHEIRVCLLPERFAGLAEELVDEGGHAVGHRVGVQVRIVERVPLPRAPEPDLEVVVLPSRVAQDAADLVTEEAPNLRKSQWNNDLTTSYGMRVSLGVSEGRKPRASPVLREHRAETGRFGDSAAARSATEEPVDPTYNPGLGFPRSSPALRWTNPASPKHCCRSHHEREAVGRSDLEVGRYRDDVAIHANEVAHVPVSNLM